MWAHGAGWWCGALAAGAVLCVLAARRRRAKRNTTRHKVHIVRIPAVYLAPRPARAATARAAPPRAPRLTPATLSAAPADEPPVPQILIIQNDKPTPNPNPTTSQLPEYKGPKLPLPEQWINKRPIDYKYNIPRPLAQLSSDLGADLTQETRAKKYSATRSPSLEKDEKSPFVTATSEVFGFDSEVVQKVDPDEGTMMSPKETGENSQDASPTNLRRFRSVSTRLNMCTVTEHLDNQQERSEMQNSPRVLECSSAKDKSTASKFDFSPKLLDTMTSPRFFTPPETVSPMFFNEPSPKSVYYDSVRSPKFFPETPRETEVPQSPRALGDHLNRNGMEKVSSPRVLSARPSPKIHSCNKENYFTFEQAHALEEIPRASPRPRKYGGRNSLEKERFTPPADKDVRKYRRHNSCDTNYKTVEVNVTKCDDNKNIKDQDVVDCCAEIETLNIQPVEDKPQELMPSSANSAQARRQRLKSISLDSDNAKIIEQNLGLPIAKQMKDQMNEAYKNESTSCESMERYQKTPTNERPCFKFEEEKKKSSEEDEPKSPDLVQKKCLRQSSDTQSFIDMPRFSPKEFEITVTTDEGATCAADTQTKPKSKNLRNLTIDLTKRDSELEKELLEFDKLLEKKVKTPTLKIKATSLDSSETANLSLPQQKTLDVPQNSVSVPNTPKRQLKRILAQKNVKHDFAGAKLGYNSIQNAEQRRLYMKGQDSGIYLREHHANLMLYQPGSMRIGSRTMGSFDENMDFETTPEINVSNVDSRSYLDTGQTLGSNLLNYKQNLSVSSTNLKTLPEGVPSDDFEPSAEDEKIVKKLHRRNSNQSLLLSTHSLQSSNCSLNSSGASCHNLATVRTSISNFSLNDRKKLSLERRDSNSSSVNEHITPTTRVICSSNTSLSGDSKNCLLQRRGSNNSLTLNIQSSLSRHSSNSSLNKDAKAGQKKGLLERRSSNTSLTLSINNSNPQLSVNRGLSISNYNLNGSTCNLSRYNSNHSIDNANMTANEPKKGILERRSSNTSLTLNIPQEPRDIEIDDQIEIIDNNLTELPRRDTHRKSLSTENLIPKPRNARSRRTTDKSFGSHDNLWSTSYTEQEYPQNLTYVCGDQENEIIYAFGRQDDPNFQAGFVRNITTKPLSPQSTSEDFRLYLANMQHLQNASSVLSRQQLQDLNDVFQNGYSKVKCHSSTEGQHCCTGRVEDMAKENPQTIIPEITSRPCSEYQKMLLRNLHQEFWDMPTNFQEKPIVSGSHTKNRYKTILPNEHSRFLLRTDVGNTEGYINANFIKGHEYTKNSYIATQGPLHNTIYDFWLMVHQNSTDHRCRRPHDPSEGATAPAPVQKVVMLTNFIENNRQKCEKYFPLELNEQIEIKSFEDETNGFTVKNCGMIRRAGYTIRKLDVRYVKCEPSEQSDIDSSVQVVSESDSDITSDSDIASKSDSDTNSDGSVIVYHYWFHNWADHKCPKDVNALLNLSLDVLKDYLYDFDLTTDENEDLCKCNDSPKPESKFLFPPLETTTPCEVTVSISTPLDITIETLSPPTIVHCSAGIGRTGCLIAILNGIKQLSSEQKVDVLGIVCNMRLNRGGMVQNSEQYELIHKVLCVYEQACLPKL